MCIQSNCKVIYLLFKDDTHNWNYKRTDVDTLLLHSFHQYTRTLNAVYELTINWEPK